MRLYTKKIKYCNDCPNAKIDRQYGIKIICNEYGKFIGWLNGKNYSIPKYCQLTEIDENYPELIQLNIIQLKHDLKLTNIAGHTINWKAGQEFKIIEKIEDILNLPFFHIIPNDAITQFNNTHKIPLTDKTIQDHFKWITGCDPFPPPEYIDKKEFEI